MADALVSTPVALTAGVVAAALIAVAGKQIKKEKKDNLVALMGVTGAFVFAAQMVNFSIPGTGSSGHIIGGVLLAALLGPWAAFLTLASVLIIQCLVFADGGLLALGCNILNMGAMTTLVAYPLIFRPLMKYPASTWKIFGVSVLACVVGLELGACMVTAETELSGITALPATSFLALMTSIHLAIGVGEGLATGAVLCYVQKARPTLLYTPDSGKEVKQRSMKTVIITFAIAALAIGGGLAFLASGNPDGLEWSIAKLTGATELSTTASTVASSAANIQSSTAFMPDYENIFSGIIGSVMVLLIVVAIAGIIRHRNSKASATVK